MLTSSPLPSHILPTLRLKANPTSSGAFSLSSFLRTSSISFSILVPKALLWELRDRGSPFRSATNLLCELAQVTESCQGWIFFFFYLLNYEVELDSSGVPSRSAFVFGSPSPLSPPFCGLYSKVQNHFSLQYCHIQHFSPQKFCLVSTRQQTIQAEILPFDSFVSSQEPPLGSALGRCSLNSCFLNVGKEVRCGMKL